MAKKKIADIEPESTPTRNRRGTVGDRKKLAEHLFLTTNLTQNEIAEIAGVTPKTMSVWVQENNEAWKLNKAARSITKEQVIAGYYRQLYNLNQLIQDREGNKFPTSSEADTIAKLSTTIERLEKSYQFGTYYQIVDELMEFISRRDQEAASRLALHSLDFVKSKAASLNGKK